MVISPELQLKTYRNADSLGKGSRVASYGVWQSHFCSQTRLEVDYPLDILKISGHFSRDPLRTVKFFHLVRRHPG